MSTCPRRIVHYCGIQSISRTLFIQVCMKFRIYIYIYIYIYIFYNIFTYVLYGYRNVKNIMYHDYCMLRAIHAIRMQACEDRCHLLLYYYSTALIKLLNYICMQCQGRTRLHVAHMYFQQRIATLIALRTAL